MKTNLKIGNEIANKKGKQIELTLVVSLGVQEPIPGKYLNAELGGRKVFDWFSITVAAKSCMKSGFNSRL